MTNSLRPDVVALVGDFAFKGRMAAVQLPPCLEVLAGLEAPLGAFAVPGNHDMPRYRDGRAYQEAVASTHITDLTNRSVRLATGGETLWLAGVDDLWCGKPDLRAALAGVPEEAVAVLLSHNPDFAEEVLDDRVGLVLSGHTHGGQAYLPLVGSPWLRSRYGTKYLGGLVDGPAAQVFVTRGLGESVVPMRINSPPEMNLLTLLAAD